MAKTALMRLSSKLLNGDTSFSNSDIDQEFFLSCTLYNRSLWGFHPKQRPFYEKEVSFRGLQLFLGSETWLDGFFSSFQRVTGRGVARESAKRYTHRRPPFCRRWCRSTASREPTITRGSWKTRQKSTILPRPTFWNGEAFYLIFFIRIILFILSFEIVSRKDSETHRPRDRWVTCGNGEALETGFKNWRTAATMIAYCPQI